MNITSTIITASDGTPLSLYDVCRFLSKQQWKHILKQLKQEGIHIERIEAYEYPEVRDIKHLFIRFEKEKEDTPFYLLSLETPAPKPGNWPMMSFSPLIPSMLE